MRGIGGKERMAEVREENAGMERLWSRDSEVANEISRGGHVLGMIVVGAR